MKCRKFAGKTRKILILPTTLGPDGKYKLGDSLRIIYNRKTLLPEMNSNKSKDYNLKLSYARQPTGLFWC